jgi:lipopolysaccharide/colanic/teichoic acid biosynthesis glycosyltransferase
MHDSLDSIEDNDVIAAHVWTAAPNTAHAGRAERADWYRAWGKRSFDVVGALVALIALSPVILALALVVALDGGRPLFFQRRVGRDGVLFPCCKIRSMRRDADVVLKRILAEDPEARAEWERDHKLANDPRVTRFGAFLRATSLDELPQLGNVLLGQMSLVGPRPVIEDEMARYGAYAAEYKKVRPGLTGLWQVSGRNALSYEARVALDVRYVRTQSLWLDLSILARTACAVLGRTGC